jgi:hypothetical protein
MCVQVENAALQEALGRAASQLYVALGERMVGADAESEVVRFKSASLPQHPLKGLQLGLAHDSRCLGMHHHWSSDGNASNLTRRQLYINLIPDSRP